MLSTLFDAIRYCWRATDSTESISYRAKHSEPGARAIIRSRVGFAAPVPFAAVAPPRRHVWSVHGSSAASSGKRRTKISLYCSKHHFAVGGRPLGPQRKALCAEGADPSNSTKSLYAATGLSTRSRYKITSGTSVFSVSVLRLPCSTVPVPPTTTSSSSASHSRVQCSWGSNSAPTASSPMRKSQ